MKICPEIIKILTEKVSEFNKAIIHSVIAWQVDRIILATKEIGDVGSGIRSKILTKYL